MSRFERRRGHQLEKKKGRRSWDGDPEGCCHVNLRSGEGPNRRSSQKCSLKLEQRFHRRQINSLHQRLHGSGFLALHWFGNFGHSPVSLNRFVLPVRHVTAREWPQPLWLQPSHQPFCPAGASASRRHAGFKTLSYYCLIHVINGLVGSIFFAFFKVFLAILSSLTRFALLGINVR